jgi:hypothetical protein
MKLDPKRIKPDESRSNPMVVAYSCPDCPMSERRPCFFIVVGPGSMHEVCQHFKDRCTVEVADIECTYDADVAAMQSP